MRRFVVLAGVLISGAAAYGENATVVVRSDTRWADVVDAYLWQSSPGNNSGFSTALYTGDVGGEKTTLIRFDLAFLPKGAQVTRARVFLTFSDGSAVPIRVHAATVPWEESVVTWTSFDGGFDPAVAATFQSAAGMFDVTNLVQEWAGGRANRGLYLEQDPGTDPTQFYSSNEPVVARRPRMEVDFRAPAPIEAVVLPATGDAYVWSANPNLNYCCTGYDSSGTYGGGQKVGLVKFDLSALPKGTTVVSAVLRLKHDPGYPAQQNRVQPAAKPWDEATVTWASFGGVPSPEPEIAFSPAADGGHTEVEVRAIVQPWVDGAPNHGFVLDEDGREATWWYSNEATADRRPQLRVQFVAPVRDAGTAADGGTPAPNGKRFFGVGCSAAPAGASWLLLALLSAARRRRRSR